LGGFCKLSLSIATASTERHSGCWETCWGSGRHLGDASG